MHGKVIYACNLFIREASNRLSQWKFNCARQAINLYAERPYLQPGLPEARDFAQATEHSKQLTNAFRSDIQKYWDELENARRKLQVSSPLTSISTASATPTCWPHSVHAPMHAKRILCCRMMQWRICMQSLDSFNELCGGFDLQELACVDLAGEITERALELVRAHIEAAAAHDREEAAARLLRELELEDAGKKVVQPAVDALNICLC